MSTYVPCPGDIGLIQMKGMVGWAIRIGQGFNGDGWHDYQHVLVHAGRVEYMQGSRIVEAMPGGALNSRLDKYPSGKILWLRCPPAYRDAVAAAALTYVGVPYSVADYAALALHRFRIPTPRLKRYIASSRRLICSQLADQAALDGGWHLFDDGRWPGAVTPGDITKVARLQKPGEYIERARVSR